MTAVDLRHHGDRELAPGLLDLAVNVAPGPPPDRILAAVLSACGRLDRYPDPSSATAATARRHGRAPGEVLLTAGAAEAFTLIAHGLPRGRAAIVHPQFSEPERALRAAGWAVHHVPVEPGATLDPDQVPDDCSLVVVGNPTNPTGVLHPRERLLRLRRPGRIVLVDEAFMDAVPDEPEALADIDDPTGLLVTRSLTKTWGLAGLRIGYLLGDRAAVAACAEVQPHWAVSAPALAAALGAAAPDAVAFLTARARRLAEQRWELVAGLVARWLTVVPGVAPFVLARDPQRPDLHARLRDQGVAVRRADTFPGLGQGGWVRISVRDREATRRLLDALDRIGAARPPAEPPTGRVVLVGGGPGPSGSITVDGLMALQRADVVVTDRLAPLALLDHLQPHVEVIDAAKNPRGRAMSQQLINAHLVEHARRGRTVVRLKGGDPFVFGRGGEEVEACVTAGVPVQVLSGVSSAVAAPAAIGVPVTHRGVTHGFTVVSGHLPPGHPDSLVDWAALARTGTTLVLLMAVVTLPAITSALLDGGLPGRTPAAVVVDAGHPGQRSVRSTLDAVARDAAAARVQPPAVVVIGDVADPALLTATVCDRPSPATAVPCSGTR